jgi:hypothetical protein
MTPPADFVRQLHDFDSSLRCRWGKHLGQWLIEVKVRERQPSWLRERPNGLGRSARAKDLWLAWMEGYLHVLTVHPSLLTWDKVAPVLRSIRLEDTGQVAALIRKLDEEDAAWERSTDRLRDNLNEVGASELYDALTWEQGRRVSAFNPEPLATLETREGYKVQDRRRV